MEDPDFPVLEESQRIDFPLPAEANADGIIAAGGNLSPGMLISAYSQGAFPWYSQNDPILWWNPDPRCVLYPAKLHVSRRMERRLRSGAFNVSSDSAFEDVIRSCAGIKRRHEDGTWIDEDIIRSYCELHELGLAHSIETWTESDAGPVLAGGLYGISLGRCFFGESMFSRVTDASKTAFISMVRTLADRGIELIDCQITTPHLQSLGAEEISRADYMKILKELLDYPDLRGKWELF
ncbi:MAG: leucyl/phenylalanyl-tRNA--protein transferase [Spirochaetales bacterium]|uniref:Leucyl/phenylalanyl-tRNA--protein transferase n=1 Tax=Candidatus Thalassospirochaeta sargassi TaxID=3119039 RepID=A0AAJ1MM86_9SPIO|nr:leucyl/phenylalanyl-tRNA--protein transferase [Spirochaetales bacterium]